MGRQRRPRAGAEDAGPTPGVYPIDTGTCELVADSLHPQGWVVKVNGVESSHVNLSDPQRLDFEYMRWIAMLVRERWPVDARLRALHLGGGACSLARHVAAVYPQSRQVVVEIDGKLAELVRTWFDLPRAPRLRIRVGEAREVTESLTEATRDLVIRDVFAGEVTPEPLTTLEFTRHVRRVLAPGGMYVVNCGDHRDLTTARREAATLGAVFTHTVAVADPAMLKGRRYGNIVLAGSDAPLGRSPGLARDLLGGAVPAHVWQDEQVRHFAGTSRPLLDPPASTPTPPG
ncbi:spermidine synthase [Rhodococcus triatomae]|uniref:Spermidine synthase n=1 Tax=Rhodococcus triatomae TaxID=300028 RepID=A0A1G8L0G2_9NOCA|nr:fused MFS/spermidine synthase [Rhodococcus triatomae]QNG20478.1 spermidine synthase [Rhodococcus triatomae]QNG23604.1 spermidine synthase [Rhodococcus triatomae]SDI49225.1 spermidine synthase [Rhodococcus triatomae]